jgi:hypothetical protein
MPVFEYNSGLYRDPFISARQVPGAYLRPAVISAVNPATGAVTVDWLDYPGQRSNIPMYLSGQGIFEMPTVGAKVLVGFDKGFGAHIVRYIQPGYKTLINDSTIWAMKPGEKMLLSYLNDGYTKESSPEPTGTYFYMNNTGNILMTNRNGDRWLLDTAENIIEQQSMNYKISTEAGILDFGLLKREINEKLLIISNTPGASATPLTTGLSALTEFRLRLLETADADSTTASEVDDPYIELVLGTKVTNDIVPIKVLTDTTYAVPFKEIMIQLKAKVDSTSVNVSSVASSQGFEFTVDKAGNMTLKVSGDVRVDVVGKSDITVNGDANITAKNITMKADEIKIAGNKKEQPVVLKDFIVNSYNTHTHMSSAPATPTSPVIIPSLLIPGKDISDITKAG